MTRAFDGVIVGAGAAGMLAALRAADLGATVALLDPGQGTRSNLVASGGMFSAAGTRFQQVAGIDDGPARWASDILRKTGGAVDDGILASVTRRAADAAHFLADRIGLDLHVTIGLDIPGHTATRLHATPAESGRELAALLQAAVQRAPGIERVDATASSLLPDGGRIAGVQTEAGTALHGRHVLLASGGFAGNRDMLARHLPDVVDAVNIALGPNDGWAIEAGAALGGALLLMDGYQGQGHITADGLGRLGPGLTSYGAIVVNAHGLRFADESMGPSEFGAHVLAQPGGQAIEVFDSTIHAAALRLGPYREVCARGLVLEAGDIPGLAHLFGLPQYALHRTLAAYHATVDGAPDPFGRTTALRRLEPPFMAARITGGIAHTQGGLRVDDAARVLRHDGSAIPGLLAAGGAAASISGHGAAGYLPGNGLGHAFALGLIAGETIAQG